MLSSAPGTRWFWRGSGQRCVSVEVFASCGFEDIDRDGSSGLTINFNFPNGTQAVFLWFWVDGEGDVLNEEFSQLPGEAAGGEP